MSHMRSRPTIYVIDDDLAVQDSLKALLESVDLEVRTFATGPEFLNAIDHDSSGCVILDLDLPVMTGLEVLDHLASKRTDLPVILITGRADTEVRRRSETSSAAALLEKPMSEDMLLGTIASVLDAARESQTAE